MSDLEESVKTWWILFPLKGLEVTDPQHDLLQPTFGDIAFVTKKHIREIVHILELNQRMSPGHDHESDVVHMLEHIAINDKFDTYMAVKRTGPVPKHELEPQFVKDARERAHQVAALLSLVFLTLNKQRETCALVEQYQPQTRSLTMLDLKDGSFHMQFGGVHSYTIRDRKSNIRISRSNLKRLLIKTAFRSLSEVLLLYNSNLPKSIQRLISQASIRLSDAIHNTSASAQLLGAVTAMEILLTAEEGEKYDVIRQRISSILGEDITNHYDAKTVFHSRHLYVHRGENVDGYSVPFNAISLALLSVLNYAKLSKGFPDKLSFIQYLDYLRKAGDISRLLTAKERQSLNKVIRSKNITITLPFFDIRNER